MKTNLSNQGSRALTLVEVLVVLLALLIVAAILLPALAASKRKSSYISCANNLKQIGLAYRIWAGDNGDKLPMEVSVATGGAMEQLGQNPWMSYLVMSNELSTPKVLICPQDTNHVYATNFSTGFSAKNVSYFIGLDATLSRPQALLAGDDNFLINGLPVESGLIELTSDTPCTWNSNRHVANETSWWIFKKKTGYGNISLADGSVQQLSSSGLKIQLQQTGFATNRLAIP